ncbi:MAG: winged helix-turn-helix domain-containing protein, partial [Alphaproteobacteria bacterium]|nr:winged helix-turn-helix domain-containing protein [Alphaproteobacteria bacterium]MBU1827731.1 winged helix-turn-helix domain-containing protein [Alphaproteobacteria bacterium]
MDATHLNEEEQNSPLADRVYGEVLSQIISGVLEVGAKLPSENDYCRMFSVSRPIVRVALSRLCADGIVERKRGSGTYIKRRPSRRLS